MKFGLWFCNTGRYVDPQGAVALAQAAEAAGFESVWTVEHTIIPAGYASAYPYDGSGKMPGGRDDFPLPDPLIWMAFVAAATTKIKLATGILILPQRNPVLAAKQIATLDHFFAWSRPARHRHRLAARRVRRAWRTLRRTGGQD